MVVAQNGSGLVTDYSGYFGYFFDLIRLFRRWSSFRFAFSVGYSSELCGTSGCFIRWFFEIPIDSNYGFL